MMTKMRKKIVITFPLPKLKVEFRRRGISTQVKRYFRIKDVFRISFLFVDCNAFLSLEKELTQKKRDKIFLQKDSFTLIQIQSKMKREKSNCVDVRLQSSRPSVCVVCVSSGKATPSKYTHCIVFSITPHIGQGVITQGEKPP